MSEMLLEHTEDGLHQYLLDIQQFCLLDPDPGGQYRPFGGSQAV